jgi:hypothetical protein
MNDYMVRDIDQVSTTHLYALVWAMLEREEIDTSRPKLIKKVHKREYNMMVWISGIRRGRLCDGTEQRNNYKWSILPGVGS